MILGDGDWQHKLESSAQLVGLLASPKYAPSVE